MNRAERRKRFRNILLGDRCVFPASVFDPISARIAEDLGFEAGMLGGSVASFAILGAPDLMLVTLTELAEQTRRICRASNLPIMVDADHGYGNALNVKRTVEELESAGACALTIEDTLLPASFGEADSVRLISVEEGCGKIRAALAGRQDQDLVIVARSSAVDVTNLNDAVERFKSYESMGADAIFLPVVGVRGQLETISKAIKIPIIIGNAKSGVDDHDYLRTNNVRICLQGHLPFAAAVRAVYETLNALRQGTVPAEIPNVATNAYLKQVTRETDYRRNMDEFLSRVAR